MFFFSVVLQVIGRQQYIVRPMMMDESSTKNASSTQSLNSETGSENLVIAGSSGVVSDAALAHAPTLTEQTIREHGIPLRQAIQKVIF